MSKNNKTNLKEIIQWIEAILIAVVIALVIRAYLFEPVIVQGSSMEHTLSTGERLIIYKLGYKFAGPKHGDIVVLKHSEVYDNNSFVSKIPFIGKQLFHTNEIDYIKRIIGVAGDIIDIKDGNVYVNKTIINETYIIGDTYPQNINFPVEVPADSYFVMGDNRQNSKDSRDSTVGMIKKNDIKGKAVIRIWPINEIGLIE